MTHWYSSPKCGCSSLASASQLASMKSCATWVQLEPKVLQAWKKASSRSGRGRFAFHFSHRSLAPQEYEHEDSPIDGHCEKHPDGANGSLHKRRHSE